MFSNLNIICLALFFSAQALGIPLQATFPIGWEGKTIGFQTNDPQVEYMRPESWELQRDKTLVQETGTDALLYTVFRPSYATALPYVTQEKAKGSAKIFLPLPSVLQKAELFIDDLIGKVEVEQVPHPTLNQSPYLYFKIRMNPAQFATAKRLAQSGAGIVLTGSVLYSYETVEGSNETAASLVGSFDQKSLNARPDQERYGLEWLIDIFGASDLYLEGSLDGRYSLGLTSLTLTDSVIQMRLDPNRTHFSRQGNRVILRNLGENARGRISLHIRELDVNVALDVRYAISGNIDLLNATVTLDSIELLDLVSSDTSAQPFVIRALNNYIKSSAVKQRLSRDLSAELQDRILSGDLFF